MSKKSYNFYKAYRLWKDALKEDSNYLSYLNSLNVPSSGNVDLNGVVGNKTMDLEWVKKVEEALPYMDKAIRMNRSFIEQKDEIVPVEKVKRVNTQSVRHLAQHTNLIAKVEENGDVLPDRILNIYYESSFAIYENRFLYSLLNKLLDFVEKKYEALVNLDEKVEVVYNINKIVKRKRKTARMDLKFEYNTNASTNFSVDDDPDNLSDFARVIRIRSIIQDFYTTTLIRDLASLNVEPVRPPIINTNLMAKNVNFRTCKDLWEYIDRYRGPGFFYEDKKFDGKMPDKIKNSLQDIFVFTNFLNEITFNSEFHKNLQKDYNKKLRIIAKKEKLAQQEKVARIEKKTEREVSRKLLKQYSKKEKELIDNQTKKEITLNKKIESLKNKNKILEEKYARLKEKAAKQKMQFFEYQLINKSFSSKNDEKIEKNSENSVKIAQKDEILNLSEKIAVTKLKKNVTNQKELSLLKQLKNTLQEIENMNLDPSINEESKKAN